MADFNFQNPDYDTVFKERAIRLAQLRTSPELLAAAYDYYRRNPAVFMDHWLVTFDPRNVERDLPALIPFKLFPKQVEWVDWVVDHWKRRKPGLTDKSRDMGMSWLSVGLAITLCIFNPGTVIGFGSRKEEYVDLKGDDKSLFHRARVMMNQLPEEFKQGWTERDSPSMRLNFPNNGSHITGEAGDNIGRGSRASIYFVDEAAFLEHPELIERSLSQTTNCRMDISTPNGPGNVFHQKRFSGNVDVFTMFYQDDPRKFFQNEDGTWNNEWFEKQQRELDEVTLAQEVLIDYNASVEGRVIESKWINAAIGAHQALGIPITGSKWAALDVADKGKDKCALAGGQGILLDYIEVWSGKGSDVLMSVEKTFITCDKNGFIRLAYDGDGIGGDIDGMARIINERRATQARNKIIADMFKGSGCVLYPSKQDVRGHKNEDHFANRKAQAWWNLRMRFERTYHAVEQKKLKDAGHIVNEIEYDPDDLISIDPNLPNLSKLQQELCQPIWSLNGGGKILIDKQPAGTVSPNMADAVMMRYAPQKRAMLITNNDLEHFSRNSSMAPSGAANNRWGITAELLQHFS